MQRYLTHLASAVLLVFVFTFFSFYSFAEETTLPFTTVSDGSDLAVNFQFTDEIVQFTFISPSGKEFTVDTEGVAYYEATEDLWATYRIYNAEAGEWYIRYDIGNNSSVDYSIIDDSLEFTTEADDNNTEAETSEFYFVPIDDDELLIEEPTTAEALAENTVSIPYPLIIGAVALILLLVFLFFRMVRK